METHLISLMTKIGTAVQTGLTSMHRLVRPGKVTLLKCKFYFTIVYLSLRRSKCIYGTPDLDFGWRVMASGRFNPNPDRLDRLARAVKPVQAA